MLLYFFATLCITLATGYNITNNDEMYFSKSKVIWPKTYSVKVTQMSLTSNVVLEMQQWKDKHSMRIDYNGGSVKSLATLGNSRHHYRNGVKYEIFPITIDGENPAIKCKQIPNVWLRSLTSILPIVKKMKAVGIETINDKKTVRFESMTNINEAIESRRTIWAQYKMYKRKKVWIPEDFCHIANVTRFPIRGFTNVTAFSQEATKVAVFNHGPLSVAVSATDEFVHYSSGIFYEKNCNPNFLSHEVALVGYGERNGDLFWILKNSWGTSWGIDGYMLISAKDNICGVTTEAKYAVF